MIFSPSYFDEQRWQNLSRIARNVLMYLYARANGAGVCYPSITKICDDLIHDRKSTIAATKELEKTEWIARDIKPGLSTVYRIQPVGKEPPVGIQQPVVENHMTSVDSTTEPVGKEPPKQIKNKTRTEYSDVLNGKAIEIVRFFNETCKTTYRENSKEFLKNVIARINDGYTVEDFKKIVLFKFNQWNDDPKMKEYIRPSTLFRASHFEEYLQDATKATQPQQKKVAL